MGADTEQMWRGRRRDVPSPGCHRPPRWVWCRVRPFVTVLGPQRLFTLCSADIIPTFHVQHNWFHVLINLASKLIAVVWFILLISYCQLLQLCLFHGNTCICNSQLDSCIWVWFGAFFVCFSSFFSLPPPLLLFFPLFSFPSHISVLTRTLPFLGKCSLCRVSGGFYVKYVQEIDGITNSLWDVSVVPSFKVLVELVMR